MKIEFDQALIEEALQKTALQAFTDSLSGWEVKASLGKALSHQIADGVVTEALRLAMEKINLAGLSAALAAEMEKAATAAVVGILRSAFVDCVLRLRGVNLYNDEATRKAREMVTAELFHK